MDAIFFHCVKCNSYSKTPKDFDERKHFVFCPNCKAGMYLTHGLPKELGLKKQVHGVLKLHGEKI